jgi:hypothetical protein
MSPAKKKKNVLESSKISAKRNVNIGDRTTINVYGLEANQGDLEFVIKIYGGLVGFFAIAALVLLVTPKPVIFPNDYIASFAAGGFFALGSLILVVFLRSKQKSSISKIISDEIQSSS